MQREANPTDHERTVKRRRGRALALVWLLAWSAWALEPCCEAVAAVIPHHPEAGAAPVHEGHDHAAHHDNGPASKDHSHCPNAKPVDLSTPAPVASTGSSYRVQSPLYLPASRVALAPSHAQQLALLRLRYRLPPPTSPPPFLVQRLLI